MVIEKTDVKYFGKHMQIDLQAWQGKSVPLGPWIGFLIALYLLRPTTYCYEVHQNSAFISIMNSILVRDRLESGPCDSSASSYNDDYLGNPGAESRKVTDADVALQPELIML